MGLVIISCEVYREFFNGDAIALSILRREVMGLNGLWCPGRGVKISREKKTGEVERGSRKGDKMGKMVLGDKERSDGSRNKERSAGFSVDGMKDEFRASQSDNGEKSQP
jgi:hypothetical protein